MDWKIQAWSTVTNKLEEKIEAKKECGWEFLFLGANIDAGKEAEKIGINRNRSVTYENDSEGIAVNFEAVGRALSKAVTCEDASVFLVDDWKEDIEKYHEESQRKRQKA